MVDNVLDVGEWVDDGQEFGLDITRLDTTLDFLMKGLKSQCSRR